MAFAGWWSLIEMPKNRILPSRLSCSIASSQYPWPSHSSDQTHIVGRLPRARSPSPDPPGRALRGAGVSRAAIVSTRSTVAGNARDAVGGARRAGAGPGVRRHGHVPADEARALAAALDHL